jgi:hypothetical protein
MKRKGLKYLATFLLTLSFAVLTAVPARAEPTLRHWVDENGEGWLYGCVPYELALALVAHAGFEIGRAPPLVACAAPIGEVYVPVYKRLGS